MADGEKGATPADDTAENKTEESPKRKPKQAPGEIGGPDGPEPTRYGDWERNGICTDF